MEDEPKNLKECFEYLDRELDSEVIEQIKSMKDSKETIMLHFSLGMQNHASRWTYKIPNR
jgi:hypothetical protein